MTQKSIYLEQMFIKAVAAMKNAHVPYSRFPVGSCIKAINNKLFAGCNVENAAYPSSQCAEASAIGNMVTEGEKIITDMLIVVEEGAFASPCGNCRQRISEFATAETLIHVCTPSKVIRSILFKDLLPFPFIKRP